MRPLAELDAGGIETVLFDIDDTLTTDGKLTARAYDSFGVSRGQCHWYGSRGGITVSVDSNYTLILGYANPLPDGLDKPSIGLMRHKKINLAPIDSQVRVVGIGKAGLCSGKMGGTSHNRKGMFFYRPAIHPDFYGRV